MSAGRLGGLGFKEFQAERARLASGGARLADMGESNLYRALPAAFPGRFPAVVESQDPKARYRCHVAELFLDRWGMGWEAKGRVSVCEGVRGSIEAAFSVLAKRGAKALLPSDVYPFYAEAARRAGLAFEGYQAREGLPAEAALAGAGALLVCDPLKPWGGEIAQAEAERLSAWAMGDPRGRLLMVDAAYGIDLSPAAARWAREGSALVMASASKGWLMPRHAGAALAPEPWAPELRAAVGARPKDEASLAKAWEAMGSHPGRPGDVAMAVAELAEQALGRLGESRRGLRLAGYFAISPLGADEWLSRGVVAIPASAFGSDWGGSALSVLPAARGA